MKEPTRPRVIVTRPAEDAASFAAALREAGFNPILSPVLTIEFSPQPPNVDDAVDGAGALAFTSANGVRALGRPCAKLSAIPVFAVGTLTAAAASEAGYRDVTAATGDVVSLSETIAAAHAARRFTGPVVHASGRDRAGDLIEALTAAGVRSRRVAAYAAIAAPSLSPAALEALAAEPPAEWAALFSPRSARLFADHVRRSGLSDRLDQVRAACLSPAVAEAANGLGWAGVFIASERTGDGLIAAMRSAPPRA